MDATTELVIKIISDTKQALKNNKGFGLSLGFLGTAAAAASAIAVAAIAAIGVAILAVGVAAFRTAADLVAFGRDVNVAMGQVAATTGATEEEMEGLRKTSLNLLAAGIPGSIGEIATAMSQVERVTGAAGEELEVLTARSLQFQKVFDVEVGESIRAVDQAVIAFGVTGTSVFDQMTVVMQRTGDPAGDLAETVNEYAPLFAEAGFSATQMFSILESGLEGGARNFDIVADGIKEANIRLVEGADGITGALDNMFRAIGEGSQRFDDLTRELGDAEQALADNEAALESAEGAYATIKDEVKNLERALANARRELKELATPNLQGMKDFDDQLFFLGQGANRAQLALLDLEKDTPEFEAAQAALDGINKQIDRVSLERDITLEPQLRAIEEAAREGAEPLVSFDEALANIANKKGEIARLEEAFAGANAEMMANEEQIKLLAEAQLTLVENVVMLEETIEEATSSAQDFLAEIASGSITSAEALQQIQEKIRGIDDAVLQQNIIRELGTQFEDMGVQAFLALDLTGEKLGEVAGATEAAFAQTVMMGERWKTLGNRIFVALEPIAQLLLPLFNDGLALAIEFADLAIPIFQQFAADFEERFGPALADVGDAIFRIAEAFGFSTDKSTIFRNTLDLLVIGFDIILAIVTLTGVGFQIFAGFVETTMRTLRRLRRGVEPVVEVLQSLIELASNLPDLSGVGSSFRLPRFANGVQGFGGGMALVGEGQMGGEIVNLPRGADVIPNRQTEEMMGGDSISITIDARGAVDPSGIEAAGDMLIRKLRSMGRR